MLRLSVFLYHSGFLLNSDNGQIEPKQFEREGKQLNYCLLTVILVFWLDAD